MRTIITSTVSIGTRRGVVSAATSTGVGYGYRGATPTVPAAQPGERGGVHGVPLAAEVRIHLGVVFLFNTQSSSSVSIYILEEI